LDTTGFTPQEKTIGEKYNKALDEWLRRELLAKAGSGSAVVSEYSYPARKELIGTKRDWKRKGETTEDLSTKSVWEKGEKAHKSMHYASVRVDRVLKLVARVPERSYR
jgi:hypothetical protein